MDILKKEFCIGIRVTNYENVYYIFYTRKRFSIFTSHWKPYIEEINPNFITVKKFNTKEELREFVKKKFKNIKEVEG